MENSKFIDATSGIVDFLLCIYGESIPDVVNIKMAQADGDAGTLREYLDCVESFCADMKGQLDFIKKEEIPSNSCNSDKNLQGFDADYLQSKIDAFTEARRKDGKTADEMLDDCRGGALELTWQDIRKIVTIADDIADFNTYRNRDTGEEDYYSEVLRKFNEE